MENKEGTVVLILPGHQGTVLTRTLALKKKKTTTFLVDQKWMGQVSLLENMALKKGTLSY